MSGLAKEGFKIPYMTSNGYADGKEHPAIQDYTKAVVSGEKAYNDYGSLVTIVNLNDIGSENRVVLVHRSQELMKLLKKEDFKEGQFATLGTYNSEKGEHGNFHFGNLQYDINLDCAFARLKQYEQEKNSQQMQ